MWRLIANNISATVAPSGGVGAMFQCGFLTDSYCCSPDASPCSRENGNVTLAAAYSDVHPIAYIPSSRLATASVMPVLQPLTTDSSTLSQEHFNWKTLISRQYLAIEVFLTRTTSTADLVATPTQNLNLPDISNSSTRTGAIPSEMRSSSSPSASSHGISREGVAIGLPVAILSVIILVLIALLVGHHPRTRSIVTNFLSQMASNRDRSKMVIEQQRLEMPGGVAAVEMGAQERRELVA